MLFKLTKIKFFGLFSEFGGGQDKKKKKKKKSIGKIILITILALYIMGCFGFMFGNMFMSICDAYVNAGIGWLYFAYIGVMVFLLGFIGSVFVTSNQIFDAKDNDMLLAMPLRPVDILFSRLTAIVCLNYIYEAIIALPGAIVFCIMQPVTLGGVVFFILSALILPMMITAISTIFGWLFAALSSKMSNKNILNMVFNIVIIILYLIFCVRMQYYIKELASNGMAIGDAIKKALPPFYYMGNGIYDGSIADFFIFAAFAIIPFLLVFFLLSKSFVRIATTKTARKKKKYVAGEMRQTGIKRALLRNEERRFLGSPMYIYNCGIGLVFLLIAVGFAYYKRTTIIDAFEGFGMIEALAPAMCAALGIVMSMNIISSPTISLDAKTMWIAKSLPIREKDVVLSKCNTHIVISMPFLIAACVVTVIAFPMSLLMKIIVFAYPVMITVFMAYIGLILNLKFPKFDWTNESAALKRGLAPTATVMIGMATTMIPILLYIIVIQGRWDPDIYMVILTGAFLVANIIMRMYIATRGVKVFHKLQNDD